MFEQEEYKSTAKDIFWFVIEYYFEKFDNEFLITRPTITNLMFLLWIDFYKNTEIELFKDQVFIKSGLGFTLNKIFNITVDFDISKFRKTQYNKCFIKKNIRTLCDILDKYFKGYNINKRTGESFSYYIHELVTNHKLYTSLEIDRSVEFFEIVRYLNTNNLIIFDPFNSENIDIKNKKRKLLKYNYSTNSIEAHNYIKRYKNNKKLVSYCKDIVDLYNVYNKMMEIEKSDNVDREKIKYIKETIYNSMCNLEYLCNNYISENDIEES